MLAGCILYTARSKRKRYVVHLIQAYRLGSNGAPYALCASYTEWGLGEGTTETEPRIAVNIFVARCTATTRTQNSVRVGLVKHTTTGHLVQTLDGKLRPSSNQGMRRKRRERPLRSVQKDYSMATYGLGWSLRSSSCCFSFLATQASCSSLDMASPLRRRPSQSSIAFFLGKCFRLLLYQDL